MERNLALECVRVTEGAALAAWKQMGRGDEKAADQEAVDSMRSTLNTIPINGTVVIGEGERDEAPMLYIGEKVGAGGLEVDIALDPLEGTRITAKGGQNALAVLALAEKGKFLNAPDTYMEKIAVGGKYVPEGLIDLDAPLVENMQKVAKFKNIPMTELVVCTMDRPRHNYIVEAARSVGARVSFISDGDVAAIIASAIPDSGIDMYIGRGGAPEGVLSAAALRCLGGYMEARLYFRNDNERERARKWGITDLDKKYNLRDLADGEVFFAATGVTDGALLKGVRRKKNYASTHSIVMRSKTGTVRYIKADHNFSRKKGF